MFKPTKIGALCINDPNLVENSFQVFNTTELTAGAPTWPLSELYHGLVEQSWLEHKGHDNIIAELSLPVTDYWYNYALNHNAVQEYMHENCASLNPLTATEQRQHWIYIGHRQYLIEAMGVDCFYEIVLRKE